MARRISQYLGTLTWAILLAGLPLGAAASRFEPLAAESGLELYVWRDIANVYVLRDGDAALMIDVGDGSVLEHLGEIGVRRLEWVLLTHHHREQCQGHPKLRPWQAKIAIPEKERALVERPADFRKLRPSLGDAFTVHGASYVRPPVEPLAVDRGLKAMDTFTWRGREFWCLETAGNSPGSMSYLLKTGRGWLAFSGDVMLAGGRMHNWFDTEWDYGFAKGLYTLIESVSLLGSFEPALLLPSHGPVVRQAKGELDSYQQKLRRLARLYVRGYSIFIFAGADQDKASRPSVVPHLWQIGKHIFKFKGPNHSPNGYFLLADSGRALMIDCGLDQGTLDATLEGMRQRLGLKAIDAVLITHMHGDHVLGAPYLCEKWRAKLWTLDRVAGPVEQPERFEYCAVPWSYGPDVKPIKFDRLFKPGERIVWEGYELQFDWMPGQTEFGCAIQGMVDGRRVAFTGDNLFADPDDPQQDGHEALCARNSAILEEGYIYGADYLRRLKPDILLGGHSFVMDHPKALIDRYYQWGLTIRDVYKELSAEEDYRTMFDPYWVRADPYRVKLPRGGSAAVSLHVRNFLARPQRYRIAIHAPQGVVAEPAVVESTTPPESSVTVPLTLKAADDAKPGVRIAALDATLDGKRYGEWFDLIVAVP
jgi:glyoxylase-like metal-dependent hydrolase (beta-lactamase superfamily II)